MRELKQEQRSRIVRGWLVLKEKKVFVTSGKKKEQCSKGDQSSFWHESNDRAQKPNPNAATPSEPSKTRGRSVSREKMPEGRSQSEKFNRPLSKYFLKSFCTKSLGECWHFPECQFYRTKSDVSSALNAHFPIGRLKSNQTTSRKKGDDKSAVAIVKNVRQLSCVSQDTEPPDFATISRKVTRVLGPIHLHCVKQT